MGKSTIIGAYDDHFVLGTCHYVLEVKVSIVDQVHLTAHYGHVMTT